MIPRLSTKDRSSFSAVPLPKTILVAVANSKRETADIVNRGRTLERNDDTYTQMSTSKGVVDLLSLFVLAAVGADKQKTAEKNGHVPVKVGLQLMSCVDVRSCIHVPNQARQLSCQCSDERPNSTSLVSGQT